MGAHTTQALRAQRNKSQAASSGHQPNLTWPDGPAHVPTVNATRFKSMCKLLFETPEKRFQHNHIDLVGPLPPSAGYNHLLTIIDRFTHWPEAIPLSDTSATSVASAFLHHWVARFGIPLTVTSDRGPQFTSELWRQLSDSVGYKLSPTTAYHPQANGMVERFHRTLKASLKNRCDNHGDKWHHQLPWILLGLRATHKEDLDASPAELMLGDTLTIPGEILPTTTPGEDAAARAETLRNLRHDVPLMRPTPGTAHPM